MRCSGKIKAENCKYSKFSLFSRLSRPCATFCYTCYFLLLPRQWYGLANRIDICSSAARSSRGERGSPLKRSELQNDSLRRFSLRFNRKGQRPVRFREREHSCGLHRHFARECTQWIGSSRSLFLAAPRYTFCTKNQTHAYSRMGNWRQERKQKRRKYKLNSNEISTRQQVEWKDLADWLVTAAWRLHLSRATGLGNISFFFFFLFFCWQRSWLPSGDTRQIAAWEERASFYPMMIRYSTVRQLV